MSRRRREGCGPYRIRADRPLLLGTFAPSLGRRRRWPGLALAPIAFMLACAIGPETPRFTIQEENMKPSNGETGRVRRPAGNSTGVFVLCALICCIGVFLCSVGCGGGSFSYTPPSVISVTVSPSSASVLLGTTQQFTASVAGNSNTAVVWSVSNVQGGNASVGTISGQGLYTAPKDLPNPVAVTVTATSQADNTKSANVQITVTSDIQVSVQTSPANVAYVPANGTLQLTATVTSAGNPDKSVTWSVDDGQNGKAGVGTVTSTGADTATYTAPSTPPSVGSVSIHAISAAAPGASGLASVSIYKGILITAVSNSSPTPLTPFQISTVGLDVNSPVVITFSDGSGFSLTEQAIHVASDGTVVAAVPLYLNPSNGQIGPGTVNFVLTQGALSSPPGALDIQDLPPVSTYGTQPGDISRAVLNFDAMLLAQRINQLQAFQSLPGNTINTLPAQATLNTVLNAVITARQDIDQVSLDNSAVIGGGNLPDGTPVQFDQASLDLMDRISAVILGETIGTLSLPASPSFPLHALTSARRIRDGLRRSPRPSAPQFPNLVSRPRQARPITIAKATTTNLQNLLDTMKGWSNANSIIDAGQDVIATKGKDWVTDLQAASTAVGAYVDTLKASPNNQAAGAIAGVLSNIRVVADCWVDDL